MNKLAVLMLVVAASAMAFARPQSIVPSTVIPILERTEIRDDAGQFALSYLTGDGTSVSEQGALRAAGAPEDNHYVLVKSGDYSYTAPDGKIISVKYFADETGFHVEGDHLPVAPAPVHPTF